MNRLCYRLVRSVMQTDVEHAEHWHAMQGCHLEHVHFVEVSATLEERAPSVVVVLLRVVRSTGRFEA